MRNNPGKPMSINDIPVIARNAWPRAAVPINIMSCFKATGIFPYDRNIFTDTDFGPSSVTNCPESNSKNRADITNEKMKRILV